MATVTDARKTSRPPRPEALLATCRELLDELRPEERGRLAPHWDSSLDRDLGLDSLTRMELMRRLELRFGVRLAEAEVAAAETPRDLLRGLLSTSAPEAAVRVEMDALPQEAVESAPDRTRTLVEALDWHVARHPERTHVHLYGERGERAQSVTYGALREGAARVAAGLQARGLEPGEGVAIMLPTGVEYLHAFLGAILAGGVPVPIYPPMRLSQLEDHVRRHAGILENARASVLIAFRQAKGVARLLKAQAKCVRQVVTTEGLHAGGELRSPRVAPEQVAFLQYTSGSTGNPKGVVLTHANLLASLRAMGQAARVESRDVFVSWLPLYHDMGLIGAWLGSLYYGFPLVLMSPLAFLHEPVRWLRAIHAHRATLSAGPNFAYELCLRRIPEHQLQGLDLSSWRLAFNGAEPVSPDTLEGFAERFARCGLRREALTPVYGLAEATLGVAFPPLGRAPRVDRVRREPLLREGRAVPAGAGEGDVLRVVSCGRSLPGFQLRVVDETGAEAPERREGRLEFKGPAATSGYYRNPAATRALFHDDWLDSGDRAYVAEGEIYVTGRRKDVIIRAGRNIYPYELEHRVGELEGVRKGCVAVFGASAPRSRSERLVVLAETRERDALVRARLRERIQRTTADVLGAAPNEVVLAPPHTVLKTSSGKVRRQAMRELYETGRIDMRARAPWLQLVRMLWAGTVPALRRARRLARELGYAAYMWVLFALLVPVGWGSVALTPGLARRWRVFGAVARALLRLGGVRLTVSGLENVPGDRAFVLAANHSSYLDGLVLIAALPRPMAFVAKRELLQSFVPRVLLRRLGALFVERFDRRRGVEDSRQLTRALRGGHSLAYFPEGTFVRTPGLLPFRLGGFMAAAAAGAPAVPVAIRGTRSILRSGSRIPRRGAVEVHIGEPVAPEQGSDADGESVQWRAAVRLRDAVRAVILGRCGEPDLGDVRPLP